MKYCGFNFEKALGCILREPSLEGERQVKKYFRFSIQDKDKIQGDTVRKWEGPLISFGFQEEEAFKGAMRESKNVLCDIGDDFLLPQSSSFPPPKLLSKSVIISKMDCFVKVGYSWNNNEDYPILTSHCVPDSACWPSP